MPLGLAQKVFNPVAVMAAFSDEDFAVVGPSVMKLRHLQHIIHLETVCIDEAIRHDLLSDNRAQRRRLRIRDHGGVYLPSSSLKISAYCWPKKLSGRGAAWIDWCHRLLSWPLWTRPRLNRHGRNCIVWRTLDHSIAIDEIHVCLALLVEKSDNL